MCVLDDAEALGWFEHAKPRTKTILKTPKNLALIFLHLLLKKTGTLFPKAVFSA